MAEVLDISSCPLLSLADVLELSNGAARARLIEGGQVIAARQMLWPVNDAQIEHAHLGQAVARDVELHVATDAVVGGAGAHACKDGRYIHADGAAPGYVRHWMQGDLDTAYWAFAPATKRLELPTAFSLLHFNLVYGHWLTEMFPKLFVIAELAARGVRAPVLLPSTAPAYIRAVVEDVLPDLEIVTYRPHEEEVAVGRLFLPGMMQDGYNFHPSFGERVLPYARSRANDWSGSSAVFLSRKALPDPSAFRRLDNTRQVERIAADLGLEIVHPEHMPWRRQVGMFGAATLIVGEYGSALHNALFAPAGARVVALNWITDVQSRIANSRGQDIGYLLDPDGVPRTYSLARTMRGFRINPSELRRRLSPLVQAPPSRGRLAALLGR